MHPGQLTLAVDVLAHSILDDQSVEVDGIFIAAGVRPLR
jgi:hypothetical protein